MFAKSQPGCGVDQDLSPRSFNPDQKLHTVTTNTTLIEAPLKSALSIRNIPTTPCKISTALVSKHPTKEPCPITPKVDTTELSPLTSEKSLIEPCPTIPTFTVLSNPLNVDNNVPDCIPSSKINPFKTSFHERFKNYYNVRARIFSKSSPEYTNKYNRLRKYRNDCKLRKKYQHEIASIDEIRFQDNRPFGSVLLEGTEVNGLLDSGASVSVLGKDSLPFLNSIGKTIFKIQSNVSTSDGTKQPVVGVVHLLARYNSIEKLHKFFVVPSLSQELYLGFDFWKAFNIAPELHDLNVSELNVDLDIPPENPENEQHALTIDQTARLERIKLMFPSSVELGLGHTTLLKHKIDTGDSEPIKSRHYPVSPKVQALMYEEVDRMLKLGVIEESESPWNSPVVLVRKPGKNRLCLDSRRLNTVTKKMAYGLPNINGLLSRLSDTYFISCIDLKDAFWQVELEETSKEKTAFTVPGRPQYQFRVMPFGLCNAAQRLCQLMDKIFPVNVLSRVFVYLDDLLVVSSTFEEHMTLLVEVARKLRQAGLTVNLTKSRFCFKEVRYLGHIVGHGKIRPDPTKVSAIVDFPLPTTVKQVRRFVGMCAYYGKFLENFSSLSSPLTDAIRKKGNFTLTPEAVKAFEELKRALVSEPILVHPDFNEPFQIHCDASIYGVGACLMQKDVEGNDHSICYFSKKLNSSQKNYSVTELECLAAVLAVEKFRPYIELHQFTIITDHSALKWLMEQKDLHGRLARWSLRLQRFEFSIEHRKGQDNVVPDTLSREEDIAELCQNMPAVDLKSSSFASEEYIQLRDTAEANSESLPDVKVSEGFVYKRVSPRLGIPEDDLDVWRLWVPTGLTHDLVHSAHVADDSLHHGRKKTLQKLRLLYFWPRMSSQVDAYVGKCEKCKIVKRPNTVLKTEMGKPFVSERPFQHIYLDYLGPYPRSSRGNTHMLVILDHLTKFPIFTPLRHANTTLTIEALEKLVFSVFNVPETVLTDNGSQFLSHQFKSFLENYGIRHLTTPVYSAQSNASERLNQSIIKGIRMQISNDHTRWDEKLTQIAFALRSAHHETLGMSPHKALFGHEKICHGSAYPLLKSLDSLNEPDLRVHADPEKIRKIQDSLMSNIRAAHEKNEKRYNLRVRKPQWKEGQIVFRRLFPQSSSPKNFNAKFSPKFAKCRVSKVLTNNRLLLEDFKGKEIGVFHSKDIKV